MLTGGEKKWTTSFPIFGQNSIYIYIYVGMNVYAKIIGSSVAPLRELGNDARTH